MLLVCWTSKKEGDPKGFVTRCLRNSSICLLNERPPGDWREGFFARVSVTGRSLAPRPAARTTACTTLQGVPGHLGVLVEHLHGVE
jgi:hypothetical protein